ncbi:hypothetical protein E2C01_063369 [Portunus trituberculatus]|uniref:Uncharacterized protein n=1 Tax=Portunus trituberculatus TaxID=210409 RepID=A0A5B7HKN2_PORTR|nr:hypothetical protein [Portunus trituberculatus]
MQASSDPVHASSLFSSPPSLPATPSHSPSLPATSTPLPTTPRFSAGLVLIHLGPRNWCMRGGALKKTA